MDGDEYSVNYSTCPSPRLSPVTRRCPALSTQLHNSLLLELPAQHWPIFVSLSYWEVKRNCRKRTWSLFHCSFHHNRFHLKNHFSKNCEKTFSGLYAVAEWPQSRNLSEKRPFYPNVKVEPGPVWPITSGHQGDWGHFHGNIIIYGLVRH